MKISRRQFIGSTLATVVASQSQVADAASAQPSIKSISAMVLAPDGRLIVADWRSNLLVALNLPELKESKEASFNVRDLSARLAESYTSAAGDVRVTSALLHRPSQNAVLALSLGRQPNAPTGIALVTPQGKVTQVDLSRAFHGKQALSSPPGEAKLWADQLSTTFLVTDMKVFKNELIVAGLSNSNFSSTLRRIPYPFSGAQTVTAVEMYHAVHNQIESRAPVRAFSVIDVEGEPTLLAAYTCTPLVTVSMTALKDGATVRGKTIAELGFGNTPLDVLPFAVEHKGKSTDWVLVANSSKSADLLKMDDVVKASRGEGLSTPVKAPFEPYAGVRALPVPITNAQKVMDQGPQFLSVLRREPVSGQLQLVSFRKGAFFRLSDHVNEYDFPTYQYPADSEFQQQYIKPFHKMMKTDEGHSALIK
jgi:hypothetical protein